MSGKWKSTQESSSTMTIWCNGAFEIDDAQTYTNLSGEGKSQGGFINSLTMKNFSIGPIFIQNYKINKLPYAKKASWNPEVSTWYFEVNDKTWYLVEKYKCG